MARSRRDTPKADEGASEPSTTTETNAAGMPLDGSLAPDEEGVEPVLVYSHRRGLFRVVHLEPEAGRKARTQREGYTRHVCQLFPGLTVVPGSLWGFVKSNPGVASELEPRGSLEEIGAVENFAKIREDRQVGMITTSADADTLDRLLELDGLSDETRSALRDEIAELRRRDEETEDDRIKQRRARRKKNRRAF